MGKTTRLPGLVGGRQAGHDLVCGRVGQLSWVGRVAVLSVGVVGVLTAAAATAGAHLVTPAANHVALAVNATGERLSQAPVTEALDYVALGDSYSSGVGTGVYDAASGACERSPLSYPPLWAAEHHPASFEFVACSGARTADVRANQISALGPTTDLVTITIGGNDAGFGPVLQTCTVAESDRTCIAAVDAAEAFERSVLRERLARTYAAIRAAAPHAHVVVLGYPRLFELTSGCADPQAPNLVRRRKLNEGADVLNSVIRSVSQQYGFSFTDVRDRFGGHGVCSTDPWINGPSVPTSVGPYHPNQTGYRDGYLDALDATTTPSPAAT
ncbi:MAG TPA: SGNH/GDSL hydrolase family protein [Pseudonocardiaceae bacterium]|nr:SGNH/GDSL hydrolase family protein [Pseudonocardiaceae bacterium]